MVVTVVSLLKYPLCERHLLCLRLETVPTSLLRLKNGGSTARSCHTDKARAVVGSTNDSWHRTEACRMDGRASMILDRS